MVFGLVACGSSTSIVRSDGGVDDAGVVGGGGGATGGGGGSTGGGGGSTGGGGGATSGGGGATGGGGGGATGGGGGATGGGGGGATGGGGGATGGGGGSTGDAGVALNGGDQCANAPDVTTGGVFVGTTTGQTDDYGPSAGNGCASGGLASGRDVAYLLNPAAETAYTVTVRPLNTTFDPMLYVQAACGANQCVTGTVLNGPGQQESVTFTVPAGQSVYVIVDGENVSNGPFELTVEF
jgi:hypothetical protein